MTVNQTVHQFSLLHWSIRNNTAGYSITEGVGRSSIIDLCTIDHNFQLAIDDHVD